MIVNLNTQVVSGIGSDADGDTISNFENVIGSDYDDLLIGIHDGSSFLFGGDGNDTINTLRGSHTADGGDGNDTLIGAPTNQTLIGGEGEDRITGGRGADIVDLRETTAATDTVVWNATSLGGIGGDTVIGFDTSTPGEGGDVLEIEVDGAVTPPGDFEDAIVLGFLKFGSADGGNDTDIFLDLDGAAVGYNFVLAGTLDGVAFEDEFAFGLLADNFDFV